MKAIIRKLDSGKAKELIAFAAENNATIVTENPFAFKVKAETYGYPNIDVMAWEDFIYAKDLSKPVVIHNIDKFVNWFSGNKLIGFSATAEDSRYNYKEEIKKDIKKYIEDEKILESYEGNDLFEDLNNILWNESSITGNGADYYDTPSKCEEYLNGNFRLLLDALHDFGADFKSLPDDENELFQYADTTIRCYLLWECLNEVLKELKVI